METARYLARRGSLGVTLYWARGGFSCLPRGLNGALIEIRLQTPTVDKNVKDGAPVVGYSIDYRLLRQSTSWALDNHPLIFL